MASVEINFNPNLTKERLLEIFKQQFNGRYEVYPTKVIGSDFVVKKSAISGVFVKLKQKENVTKVVFNKNAPSALFRGLLGIIPMIFAGGEVKAEVKNFLESSPDLK